MNSAWNLLLRQLSMRWPTRWPTFGLTLCLTVACAPAAADAEDAAPVRLRKVTIESSIDGHPQRAYVIEPPGHSPDREAPLLVSLHTWSGDWKQRRELLEVEAAARGWLYLHPNFRGANDHPEACGSLLAQQDVLDAVEWAKRNYRVDKRRIYLSGVSGGGHMTLLMAGTHPEIWAAASAWVGISDLAAWHRKHHDTSYGVMIRKCCGGAPGDSEQVDRQYRLRSPLTHLAAAKSLPLDIAAGIHDGHSGSVPIRHSLEAFNEIAKANAAPVISEREMAELSRDNGRLTAPQPSDQVEDAAYERAIYLRRTANRARVTIFEGGHETISKAAAEWLEQHIRPLQDIESLP